jgi:choline dehydrogenase-like flavoprotein
MDAYDVIIIGMGAGGTARLGTSRLRGSASSCSSAATCSPASDLWPRHACMKNEIPVAGCAHQAGTCRFGMDPVTSALNTDCWAHELDNLCIAPLGSILG